MPSLLAFVLDWRGARSTVVARVSCDEPVDIHALRQPVSASMPHSRGRPDSHGSPLTESCHVAFARCALRARSLCAIDLPFSVAAMPDHALGTSHATPEMGSVTRSTADSARNAGRPLTAPPRQAERHAPPAPARRGLDALAVNVPSREFPAPEPVVDLGPGKHCSQWATSAIAPTCTPALQVRTSLLRIRSPCSCGRNFAGHWCGRRLPRSSSARSIENMQTRNVRP